MLINIHILSYINIYYILYHIYISYVIYHLSYRIVSYHIIYHISRITYHTNLILCRTIDHQAHYITSNIGWWKKKLCHILRICSSIWVEGLRKWQRTNRRPLYLNRTNPNMTIGLRIEIWTCDLPNKKQECQSMHLNVRNVMAR